MDKLLTAQETADVLNCHLQSVYRNKELPRTLIPGIGLRFKQKELEKYLENRTISPFLSFSSDIQQNNGINRDNSLLITHENPILYSGGESEMPKGKNKTRFNFGYGAIYVRKTKYGKIRWYLDYRDGNGKRIQKLVSLATSKEEAALALREEISIELSKEYSISKRKENILFSDFARTFLQDYMTVERENWKSDEYRMWKIIEFFKDVKLKDVTAQNIRTFKKARGDEGNSKRTINRYLALLKKMFNLAIEFGYVKDNPVKPVKFFSEIDTRRERVLKKEEESKLLLECADHLRPIIITALYTGMRKSEILQLKWRNVDLERRMIIVEHTKSKKARYIPINVELFSVLFELNTRKESPDLVFPFKSIRTAFENAIDRAGVKDFTFHDLRRTFGTRLLEKGIDIVTIQRLYGHSSPVVTQRYLHPDDEISKEAVELLVDYQTDCSKTKENLLHIRDTDKSLANKNLLSHSFSVN